MSLPTPTPPIDPETRPFWAATAEGRLLLSRCDACGLVFWYPRSHCVDCGADTVSWIEASGAGKVYSYSVIRRAGGAYQGSTPYVLAYVELAEGPRLMTNIVECEPDAVTIDLPVEVVFHDSGEGVALPRFRPRAATS